MAGFIDSFTVYDISNANTTFSSDIQGRIGLYTYTNDFSNNLPVYKNSSDYYIFYSDISYGWQWRKLSDSVQDNSMNFNIQNPPPYIYGYGNGPAPGVLLYADVNGDNGELFDATISPENFVIKAGFGLTETTDIHNFYVSGSAGGSLGNESLRIGTYIKYVGGYLGADTSYNNNLVFTNGTYFIYLSNNNGWQWVAPDTNGNPFLYSASQLGSSSEVKSCRDVVTYSKFLALDNSNNSLQNIPSGLPKTPINFRLYNNNNGNLGTLVGVYTIDKLYNGAWAYKRISPNSNGLIYFSVPLNDSAKSSAADVDGWTFLESYDYMASQAGGIFNKYNNAIDFITGDGNGLYLIEIEYPVYTPLNTTDFQNALRYYFGETTTLPGGINSAAATVMNISSWNTENVTDMSGAFKDRTSFNEDISLWNTNSVTSLNSIFYGTTSFNQNVSTKYDATNDVIAWDVSGVSDKQQVFLNAHSFNNGDISGQSNNPLNY